MQNTLNPKIGTAITDLDTPCLILDMDALDHNMGVMSDYYKDKDAKLRGHSKNHKSPAIAHRQINKGGTIGGVCAAKVSEAEVMVNGGISSVFITSEIVDAGKIERLCNLAGQSQILVACENAVNAQNLSKAAMHYGVNLGVVIEVETGLTRCGIQDFDQGVDLAREISALPGLDFQGIMSHQMMEQPSSAKEDRVIEGRQLIQKILDTKSAIESEGISVNIVSTGETWSYDVAGEIPGVTEIQGGSYLVMETSYDYMTDFQFAGKILTTIISTPREGVAIGDAGIKAVGSLKGMPQVDNRRDLTVESMEANRALYRVEEGGYAKIGDQLLLIPAQQDAMVSRWDRFIGIRNGRVETVWEISARGCHN